MAGYFFFLGFLSLLAQVVILREIVAWLGGDELFYALGLGFWLFSAGWGSLLARGGFSLKKTHLWLVQLGFLTLIPLSLGGFRLGLTQLLPLGQLPSLGLMVLIVLLSVLPLAFLSGFQFGLGCRFWPQVNQAYLWETLGFFLAGIIHSFLLSQTSFPLPSNLDRLTLKARFPNLEKVVYSQGSQLVVVRQLGQRAIFSGGEVIFSSEPGLTDHLIADLLSRVFDRGRLLAFGDQNLANQLSKTLLPEESVFIYPENKIFVLQQADLDPSIKPVVADPRRFLTATQTVWDLIVVSPGNPNNLLTNRYYTLEFFQTVREKLTDRGVLTLIFYLPPDYQSQEAIRLAQTIYQTFSHAFPETELFLIDERVVLLGSRTKLRFKTGDNDQFWQLVEQDDRRQQLLSRLTATTVRPNRDNWPLAYFYHHLFWQTIFTFSWPKIINYLTWFLPLVLLAIPLFLKRRLTRERRWGLVVAGSSFVLMALETVILFLFQTKIGHLYTQLALIIATVLLGMALGVGWGDRLDQKNWISLALASYLIVFGLLLGAAQWQEKTWFWFGLALIAGLVGGLVYALANNFYLAQTKDPVFLYAWDLFGGFLGAGLTAVYLLPRLGLTNLLIFLTLWLILLMPNTGNWFRTARRLAG